uniref:Potassium channel toxin kappa-KTx 1.4 n=1 Tax=Heterometrus petersii TaxID=754296 RepID=KKX14_HETPE|nr:RecName: Full=Potassium channel toxin kappa-KTx 1.4; AltName: Full=HSP009C; Flags: Precursor [Heterometrus petersii]
MKSCLINVSLLILLLLPILGYASVNAESIDGENDFEEERGFGCFRSCWKAGHDDKTCKSMCG